MTDQMTITKNDVQVISGFTGRMAPAVVEQPVRLKRLDRVKLRNGQVFIVTGYHPNRPQNCYSGVLENGQGKEYVFGRKHCPTKIGEVSEGHPALLNNATRRGASANSGIDRGTAVLARQLAELVRDGQGDSSAAKVLAGALVVALPG